MEGKQIINAIAVVMAVVILSVIGALVIGSILDSSIFDNDIITGTNTNESLGLVDNITATDFAIISTQPTATCTLGTINNATSGAILGATNYTFTGSACTLILTDTSPYINQTLNATYDFSYDSGSGIIGIDADDIGDAFGLFITGLLAFLAIIGTIVGVVWLVYYVKALFDKKQGIQALTA